MKHTVVPYVGTRRERSIWIRFETSNDLEFLSVPCSGCNRRFGHIPDRFGLSRKVSAVILEARSATTRSTPQTPNTVVCRRRQQTTLTRDAVLSGFQLHWTERIGPSSTVCSWTSTRRDARWEVLVHFVLAVSLCFGVDFGLINTETSFRLSIVPNVLPRQPMDSSSQRFPPARQKFANCSRRVLLL